MSPALFLVVAVVLSVVGSLVAWLLLRDRSKTTDAMTDFQRRMSALAPQPPTNRATGSPNQGLAAATDPVQPACVPLCSEVPMRATEGAMRHDRGHGLTG